MKRYILEELKAWRDNSQKKPLILKGARQVGKTYILKKFAKEHFRKFHYFNFEKEPGLEEFFQDNYKAKEIIKNLSLHSNKDISSKEDLIIFDEIQSCPHALNSLKYFAEEAPGYNIASAGSLLGASLSEESFPVGKVDYLFLGPMTFSEFLAGIGDLKALKILEAAWKEKKIAKISHNLLWSRLLDYYVTGGLPEIVKDFAKNQEEPFFAYENVRKLQEGLLRDYVSDFSKHAGKLNSLHIQTVFENIPRQLAASVDENSRRYKFKNVIPKKKGYGALEGPISWLEQVGLINKIFICNRSEIPLKAFSKSNIFKLFIFDIGLLGAMLEIPPRSIVRQDYGTTKGYFAENFVAQSLVQDDFKSLFSWSEGTAEIEFLLIKEGEIVPLEVKSGINTKAKSLTSYIKRYEPSKCIMLTGNVLNDENYRKSGDKKNKVIELPIYMAEYLNGIKKLGKLF